MEMENKGTCVWDCDSSLYDSFELKSFKLHLDSAIGSQITTPPLLPPPTTAPTRPSPRWFSRSFHRILRSVFCMNPGLVSASRGEQQALDVHHSHVAGGILPTIPEMWEQGGDYSSALPEFNLTVRKSLSERFTWRIAGITCA